MGPVDTLWNIYSAIKDWIILSDAKATAILAFYGVIGGVAFSGLLSYQEPSMSDPFHFVLLVMGLVFSTCSVLFAFLCLNPRESVGEPTSLIFYRHIVDEFTKPEDYCRAVAAMLSGEDATVEQVGNQVWALSLVAKRKFEYITWAIRTLFISMIVGVVGILHIIFWG